MIFSSPFQGMTTWLCVSPRIVLLAFLLAPLLVLVCYRLMDKREADKRTRGSSFAYSALNSDGEDHPASFTCQDRLHVIRNVKLLLASLFVGCAAKFVVLQSVVTTLAFPNAPFDPRDHYQYYQLVSLTAEFVGRSYGLFLSFLKCVETPPVTRHTWLISSAIVALQIVLALASWFRLLPNVQVAFLILFLFGLLYGALYCSSFSVASRDSSSRHIEYGRAFLVFATSAAVVSAGLLGLFIEGRLAAHCLIELAQNEYCLTRWRGGWNASLPCEIPF